MSKNRVNHQPVFLLSTQPWRENSLRLSVFSRDYGRVCLLARSARTRGSELRGVIVPFVPFSASWYGQEALKTLHRAEWLGGWAQPQAKVLFSGLYIHELVLKLTALEDPNPDIYAALYRVFQQLCTQSQHTTALRHFEWSLLRALGLCPDFQTDHLGQAIRAQRQYYVESELSPIGLSAPFELSSSQHKGVVVSGKVLQAIQNNTLSGDEDIQNATQLMRMLIDFHVPELKTRAVLQQLNHLKTQFNQSIPSPTKDGGQNITKASTRIA